MKDKKRRIVLVIEDVDLETDRLAFTMQGDVDRMGTKEMDIVPTAAEYWGKTFFEMCTARLQQEAKKLNRSERRKG